MTKCSSRPLNDTGEQSRRTFPSWGTFLGLLPTLCPGFSRAAPLAELTPPPGRDLSLALGHPQTVGGRTCICALRQAHGSPSPHVCLSSLAVGKQDSERIFFHLPRLELQGNTCRRTYQMPSECLLSWLEGRETVFSSSEKWSRTGF